MNQESCAFRQERFNPTNCAAIPDNLVESEYFGRERGAFTGASLLLDEITEFPLHLQPKLLRPLQEQTFERVGGNKPIQVDVRLIATSNRPIEETLKESPREDLYDRLSVIHLHIPPLRERRDDIFPPRYSLSRAVLSRKWATQKAAEPRCGRGPTYPPLARQCPRACKRDGAAVRSQHSRHSRRKTLSPLAASPLAGIAIRSITFGALHFLDVVA